MVRDLYLHTLQGIRDVFQHEHMDTQVESLDAAIWALQTQEQLIQERDAALAALQEALKLAAERRKDGKTD